MNAMHFLSKNSIFVKTDKMTVANFQDKSNNPIAKKKLPKPISWETFKRKYLSREDSWKYEWVNGIVEKTKRFMYQEQFYILYNLRQLFTQLLVQKKISGALEAEIDSWFLKGVHRRPDVAWFSEQQIIAMGQGINQIPAFVIEIISPNDKAKTVQEKLKNYREAGVQVVWQIYPHLEEVNVCLASNSITCEGDKICSAAPVLPIYQFPTKAIFKKLKAKKEAKK